MRVPDDVGGGGESRVGLYSVDGRGAWTFVTRMVYDTPHWDEQ